MRNQRDLQRLFREIEDHYEPKNGWCDAVGCTACEMAAMQVEAAKDAARQGFMLNQGDKRRQLSGEARKRIFERGFDRGRNVALQEAHQWAAQSAHRAEEAAKNKWYQKGLREGREMARRTMPKPAQADPTAVRKKMMDQVLAECRVIGESNPQMNPAMNALRHRLKKL